MQEGQEDGLVELIADEIIKKMMRMYKEYGNRYGKYDMKRMLEEEESENVGKITNVV